MIPFLWRLLAVFGTANILLFFSEFFFVNETPVIELLHAGGLATFGVIGELALYYCLFAYILLIVMQKFQVVDFAGIFLAASLTGWSIETLIVPVAHEAPPISWIFPSIGWHALVDVLMGWFLLRLAMRKLRPARLAALFVIVGVAWSFWATWYWTEDEIGELAPMTAAQFATLAGSTGLAWIAGMWMADQAARQKFNVSKVEIAIIAVLSVVGYAGMGLAYLPFSLGLAALMLVVLLVLWRGAGKSTLDPPILASLAAQPPKISYLLAGLMPLSAFVSYVIVVEFQLALPPDIVPPILFIIGASAFFWALARTALRRSRR